MEWFDNLNLLWKLVFGIGIGFGFLFFIYMTINIMLWRKVGPNEVLIISGFRRGTYEDPRTGERMRIGYRIVRGGGSMVLPVLERTDIMSLELITLDIEYGEFYTKLGVPVRVDGVAQIKVKGDDISIHTAAEQFLSKNIQDIKYVAHETVAGHLRAILSTMTVEEIYAQQELFSQKVQEVASQDLANMGLAIVSFTIKAISDSQGYMDALGKPQIAAVKRNAVIAEAEATRDSTIRSANARQEAETAKFQAEIKIAEAQRDLNLKQQEFAKTVNLQKADADLAYDLQRYKTAQQVKQEEVQVNIVEKQKQVELQTEEIRRRQLELEATIEKPALAEKQRIEALASAEQFRLQATAQGQAEATKATGAAEGDANRFRGLAQADVIKAQGLAEADMIRAKGFAEADAVKARGLAEAEAMQNKASAFQNYNEAAVANMLVERLPQIAEAIASPLSRIDKIVLVGSGSDGVGASRITQEVTNIMAQVPPVVEAMTGIKLADMIQKAPKIDAPEPKPKKLNRPEAPEA